MKELQTGILEGEKMHGVCPVGWACERSKWAMTDPATLSTGAGTGSSVWGPSEKAVALTQLHRWEWVFVTRQTKQHLGKESQRPKPIPDAICKE